ncbi:MAG: Tyrosine recombinase XerC [Candidatus Gottesmanbacteria bacterium GW2011_GWA2_41_12]|uniref:Tyrosine recombinase XerC n=2 Tax=Candidatus Gottesmaniibacteriota TaxID=1752720 RepID=A0A0G0UI02_9BACT|nr:MAG: Tyrosine recombinase XerC [Candidatus Gottesmanbacteria bacterium GW2011_GWC2_39_8]KKR88464.1 MAG: Tyrosine recombinase XerC [Candidatus Gottesmanbacteria bacterium GW2011_GWA2_41_12]
MANEPQSNLSVAQDQFIKYLESQRRAHATILAYGKDIDQLTNFLTDMGKEQVAQVERNDLEGFLKKLSVDGYTPKSLSRKINSIKTFYRFLKTNNMITANPATEIAHPKYEMKPPRILSKIEYRALRDACRSDVRTYAIVELFLQTGIRIGELANLKLADVRTNELYIAPQESHLERTVPLNKAVKSALDAYLKIRPKTENPTLFVTKTGRPLLVRNIRTTIDRYFKIAGIEGAKVNDLRHTFIAHHLMSGTPLTVISKLVGHKRLSTTEKYLDLVKDKMPEKVKLEEL